MKYEMGKERILILDKEGKLADTVNEAIGEMSLIPPAAVDIVATEEGVVKSIKENDKYTLFIINAADYRRESVIGRIYQNGITSKIFDSEWSIIRIRKELATGLNCSCSCGI